MRYPEIDDFTARCVTGRARSLFADDIEANAARLSDAIKDKSVLVIGGAGSIGSSFIKAVLRFNPAKLVVVDLNENGLAELTRDLRSDSSLTVPPVYLTYTLDFDNPIFRKIFTEHGGFDIVANFSAHKHVRSEKDKYSVQALLENNVLKAQRFMDLLRDYPPQHFFCVSTDKAANPVNVMGASKRLMEDLIMAYTPYFKVVTARFANVAFSNGSLPLSFYDRLHKRQPLVAPVDVKRYFVSPQESGQICMLACILGESGEIFFPKLDEAQMKTFADICTDFMAECGLEPRLCSSDEEAKEMMKRYKPEDKLYPVNFFKSDTTGEKSFEEFYIEGEELDMSSFKGLGVIKARSERPDKTAMAKCCDSLAGLFAGDFTKAEVVELLGKFIPSFHHEELGKNLDQKM